MKTEIVKKSASDYPEHLIKDPPYTVYGHTTIPTSLKVAIRVGGLRQIISDYDLGDDDMLRIEVFGGDKPRATEYSFIKKPIEEVGG